MLLTGLIIGAVAILAIYNKDKVATLVAKIVSLFKKKTD